MATLSYTTNAQEDAALAWYLAGVNAQRAAQTPPQPPIDVNALNQALVAGTLASYIKQKARADVIASLTPAQRAALGE
jgi:hypothetical protein